MRQRTTFFWALAGALGLGALLSIASLVQASGSNNGDGNGGIFPCPAGYTSIKVDPPVSGTYGGIQVTFSADGKSVSFMSSFAVDIVIVKGGPGANQYGPNSGGLPATSLGGLVAPLNPGGQQPDISFVRFCVAVMTPVPTGTAAGVTATPGVSKTPTRVPASPTAGVPTLTPVVPTVTPVVPTVTPVVPTQTPAVATATPATPAVPTATPTTAPAVTPTGTVAAATQVPVTPTPVITTPTAIVTTPTPLTGAVLPQAQTPVAGVTAPDTGTGGPGGGASAAPIAAAGALALLGAGAIGLAVRRVRL